MSLFTLFSGQKVRKTVSLPEIRKFAEIEELLMEKAECLKKKIEQELLTAKKNLRTNRRLALQALRRKRWYEKHLKNIDCAVKALKSAHQHIETFNKVNDLIHDVPKEETDMAVNLLSPVHQEVGYDEDELLAELQMLEGSLDEMVSVAAGAKVCSSSVSSPSPPGPAEMEEDEDEDALEYLRRWAAEVL